jgi:uncharacterized damage-inducible protein DinB
MEIKDYVKNEFDSLKRTSTRVLDTMTQQELMWRPANGCNSMGLILFHVVRSEDSFVQTRLQGKPQIWESEKWHSKLNMGEAETGSHYTGDQVNSFRVPNMKELLDYYDAVRVSTLDYLSSLTSDAFDKVVKLPFGEFTVAGVLALVVSHTAPHLGEISYLRGMLRGMDK